MKKLPKILAVLLTVLLLVGNSISSTMVLASINGIGQTDETNEEETAKEMAAARTAGENTAGEKAGKESGSDTQQSENIKGTEAETAHPESESEKITEAETEKKETEKKETEKKETEKKETEKKETDKKETEKKQDETKAAAPTKTARDVVGVEIQSADDPALAALIPDANFRKAVYDSLSAYGWLAGDSSSPPSSVQEILETYRGPVNAAEKGIKSIEGIQYFKIATTDKRTYTIDLRDNEITSLMPLANRCGEEGFLYGGRLYCSDVKRYQWRNVNMLISGNPWKCFPKTDRNNPELGYVNLEDLNQNGREIVDSDKLRYYFLRKDTETFEGYMQVGYCRYNDEKNGEFVEIARLFFDGVKVAETETSLSSNGNNAGLQDMEIARSDQGPNKNKNADIFYTNLMKTGQHEIGVAMDYTTTVMTLDGVTSGAYSVKDTSMVYPLYPAFVIFDHLKISGDQMGSARAKKIDEITKLPVSGAEFSLYQADGTLVKGNLVTADDGYTQAVDNLPAGRYYFQETKAPENYVLNHEKQWFSVGYDSAVDGGLKSLDYTGADGKKIKAEAGEKDTYIRPGIRDSDEYVILSDMDEDVRFYLKDGSGEDKNGRDLVKKVTLVYSSLNGELNQKDECASLEAASAKLKERLSNNEITGSVEAKVEYVNPADEITVTVADMPAVKVKADKTWIGTKSSDELPKVIYTLYRKKTDSDSDKTAIISHSIEKNSVPGKYTYTFTTDGNGNALPKYWKDENGKYSEYIYKISEEIIQEGERAAYVEQGDIGVPVKSDDGRLITIPVKNYKKALIKIIKTSDSDSSGSRKKLENVGFRLEKKADDPENDWSVVEDGTTDENGELFFENLDWGEYRITETKTQPGYILLAEPIHVVIEKPSDEDSENEYIYMIENSRKYRVPNSGGIGSVRVIGLGMLLLLAGGLWGYKKRNPGSRRKRV